MTRPIDAALTAALAAGIGQPYLLGSIGYTDGSVLHSHPVLRYKLTGTTLEFEMAYTGDIAGDQTCMWLERGVTIGATDYTVTTGRFRIHEQTYSLGRMVARGALFPREYYAASGYDTYSNVITAFCTAYGKTAVFRDPAAAWLAYKFLPVGKSIILNDANSFLNMLQQKYLIFACDNGSEEVLFYSCAGSLAGAADITITAANQFSKDYTKLRACQYVWRDEAGTVHSAGAATDPIHNLGYLESTAAAPARRFAPQLFQVITRPDLRALDGDIIGLTSLGNTVKVFALVTEQFTPADRSHPQPRWETVIESNEVFGNTAGGALPSTIERVSNYTPLNTSQFNGLLGPNDNNLQAAMDRIDNVHLTYGGHGLRATIPATLTYGLAHFVSGLQNPPINSNLSFSGTLKNLCIGTAGAQPADGTLVATLYVNGAATSLTLTIAAGAAAGVFSDLTHSAPYVGGQTVRLEITNNSPTLASAPIGFFTFDIFP